jgi:NAD(P)-dependent dehydrogenase (short-subunit alcohol dehydrogenase family)
MDTEHHDRVSVITGAARGIGLACATELARAGSAVAICDLAQADADAAAAALAAEFSVAARGYAVDVREWEAVRALIERVARDFGRIDHLVNNAGVQYVSPIADFPVEKYQLVRSVDLDGVFYMTKAVWRTRSPAAVAASSTLPACKASSARPSKRHMLRRSTASSG